MPTNLPRPPDPRAGRAKQKPTKLSRALNIFMIASALALTYVVLVAEEQRAFGQRPPGAAAIEPSADARVH
ncbi:MAG: hypothetical protein ACR2K5_15785 [Pseudolabrys sp.]